MTMDAAEVERLKAMMEWEGARTAPPAGFPALPDMPAGRYTSPEYFALEQEHIFRKSCCSPRISMKFPSRAAICAGTTRAIRSSLSMATTALSARSTTPAATAARRW